MLILNFDALGEFGTVTVVTHNIHWCCILELPSHISGYLVDISDSCHKGLIIFH
jgi:ABC-type sulfate transport system permease subunit